MTFDPTTNRAPTCLLTAAEKQMLLDWPHGLAFFSYGHDAWIDMTATLAPLSPTQIYRGKPAPVVAQLWVNVFKDGILGRARARRIECDHAGASRVGVIRVEICDGKVTCSSEDI